jgi:nitrite reductase/ring-hydroxylating ferredoxin subunit
MPSLATIALFLRAIYSGEPAMAFVKVATVQEVPAGKSKQAKVGGKTLALFNVAGTLYAIDDTCPHRGAPLWEGELEGHEVICPWHAAAFDVTTGAHLCPPAKSDVTSYKVQIVGDEVQVDLP